MRFLNNGIMRALFIVILTLALIIATNKFTPDFVMAIFTVIMTMVAIYAIYEEQKRGRIALGLSVLHRLVDKFEDGDKMLGARRRCAKLLLGEYSKPVSRDEIRPIMTVILDHFQEVAELTRNKIIDFRYVWSNYEYRLRFYYPLLKKWIEADREGEPLMWEDVDWLYNEFSSMNRRSMKKEFNNLEHLDNASEEEINNMDKLLDGDFAKLNIGSRWMKGIREFLYEEKELKAVKENLLSVIKE